MLVKILAAIFDFYSSEKLGGEREIFTKRSQKEGEGRGGTMNITALRNRKRATKRNETQANLDIVVSSSGQQLRRKGVGRSMEKFFFVPFHTVNSISKLNMAG